MELMTHIILCLGKNGVDDAKLGKGLLDDLLSDHLKVPEGEAGLDIIHVFLHGHVLLYTQKVLNGGVDLGHNLLTKLLPGQGDLLHISDERGENGGKFTKSKRKIRQSHFPQAGEPPASPFHC